VIAIDDSTSSSRLYLRGDTYAAKDRIKAAGGHWDPDQRAWWLGVAKRQVAEELAQPTSSNPIEPAQTATPGICLKCGGRVKEPYKICYACKNQGKCLNCGQELDRWERQHGVKRCSNCRDGGGNARGGQSYYDRNGNFVLGDDD